MKAQILKRPRRKPIFSWTCTTCGKVAVKPAGSREAMCRCLSPIFLQAPAEALPGAILGYFVGGKTEKAA